MGIDGFSLSNLNLNINKTSSAMASEADVLARQGNENQIKDIDGMSKKQKTARKDSEAGFNGMVYLPGFEEENEEGQPQNQKESEELKQEEVSLENVENYHFRFNKEHMIEIRDTASGNIVRTISPEDAAEVLIHLTDVPGFIVNEKA